MPRRPRLLPLVVVCAILVVYFAWFNSYTHTSARLVASSEFDPSETTPTPTPETATTTTTPSNPDPKQPPQKPSPRILLVSALFPLQHSKHSHNDYRTWLAHFLGPTTGVREGADVYFYTTPELEPLVRSLWHEEDTALSSSSSSSSSSPGESSSSADHLHVNPPPPRSRRSSRPRLTINTTYTTPFSLPPIAPHKEKYTRMHAWDRERGRHNPELYAVWNAKPWLVVQALRSLRSDTGSRYHNDTTGGNGERGEDEYEDDYVYDYVFWTDAGAFRMPHAYRAWPDPVRVEEVFRTAAAAGDSNVTATAGGKGKDQVFFPLWTLPGRKEYEWTKEKGPVDMDFSEGSFFGSTPAGIAWYAREFYALHDHYISTAPLPPSSHHHPHAHAWNLTEAPSFHFVGKDQTLINALMFRNPTRFFGVLAPIRTALLPPSLSFSSSSSSSSPPAERAEEKENGAYALTLMYALARIRVAFREHATLLFGQWCGSDWYYYQWWLASPEERRATEAVRGWGPGAGDDGRGGCGRWWWWWTRLGVWLGMGWCEEARVLSVEAVLRGLFGRRWVEERMSVDV